MLKSKKMSNTIDKEAKIIKTKIIIILTIISPPLLGEQPMQVLHELDYNINYKIIQYFLLQVREI